MAAFYVIIEKSTIFFSFFLSNIMDVEWGVLGDDETFFTSRDSGQPCPFLPSFVYHITTSTGLKSTKSDDQSVDPGWG